MTRRIRPSALAVFLTTSLLAAGCSSSGDPILLDANNDNNNNNNNNNDVVVPPPGPLTSDTLTRAFSLTPGATIAQRGGSLPAATSAVQPVAVGGTASPQGGTSQVQVTSTEAFDQLLVNVGGASGFWEIDYDTPQTTVEALLTLSTDVELGGFDCIYQTRGAFSGDFSVPFSVGIDVIDVGSGQLQINLTWLTNADLDLHVTDPSGERIFFANRSSASGGELDFDANVGCGTVGIENVFWDANPPAGSFLVEVDNFSECSQVSSPFVVTISIPGRVPEIFSGAVTEADGRLGVATFDLF